MDIWRWENRVATRSDKMRIIYTVARLARAARHKPRTQWHSTELVQDSQVFWWIQPWIVSHQNQCLMWSAMLDYRLCRKS